jgi:hypothetical protein
MATGHVSAAAMVAATAMGVGKCLAARKQSGRRGK